MIRRPWPKVTNFYTAPSLLCNTSRTPGNIREKAHWHVIWLLTRPGSKHSAHSASKLVGLTPAWAAEMVKRWNAHGPDGLRDGRRENRGRPRLSSRQQVHLISALNGRAPDGGLWSGPKVAAYVQERWSIRINPATGWKWLKRLGFTLLVPRPSHPKAATVAERRGWKKSSATAGADPP